MPKAQIAAVSGDRPILKPPLRVRPRPPPQGRAHRVAGAEAINRTGARAGDGGKQRTITASTRLAGVGQRGRRFWCGSWATKHAVAGGGPGMKALPDFRRRKLGEVIRPQGKIGEADGVTGAGAVHREIASRRHGARRSTAARWPGRRGAGATGCAARFPSFFWAVRGERDRDRSGANESRRTAFGADSRG